ncbi:MAG: HD domain-containing protein [Candidatus Lokiarchaeota archaeon]|nr:HD domain-containing protein [Candidatus Harpocratesius repetitus]
MDKLSIEESHPENKNLASDILSIHIIQEWFDEYYQHFLNGSPLNADDLDAIQLKYAHSYRVMNEMEIIATSLAKSNRINSNDLEQAKIIGLLHDVARFSQYIKYHTMNDSLSEDHGDLGANIIEFESPVKNYPESIQREICIAVKYHNKISIPSDLHDRELFFTKMIRDADKLDVFHLACPIYRDYPQELGERLKLHLPSTGQPSSTVVSSFLQQIPIPFSAIRSMTDFKILQLAWVFDFNFAVSLKMCQERKYLEMIYATLPEFSEKKAIWEQIQEYIANFQENSRR